jgi:hypothetical protein
MNPSPTDAEGLLYGDVIGMCSQYFYEGWRYRLPKEGDAKIRQESNEAAHSAVDKLIQLKTAKAVQEAKLGHDV